MTALVIVESPAKAKTINKYLGKEFNVIASYGHIRDLPSKDGSVRPSEDFAMDYQIAEDARKKVKAIVEAVKNSDAIYLATDPDREGEAISWHVVEALKEKKAIDDSFPIHRISFNEVTKNAVKKALENPRAIDMDLVNAQQARRALDYLVGFNLSPVLWRKLPGSKSAGRVQSVALRLICEREEQIELFKSREYWTLKLNLFNKDQQEFAARVTNIEGKKLEQFDIKDQQHAKSLTDILAGKNYLVKSIEKKQVKRNPYPPFTTSSLQQEASRKLGFSARKTMQVAQKLYEGVMVKGENMGLITYMRTDGVTVSEEALKQVRAIIVNNYGNSYLPATPRKYYSKAKNAQEAHEAIRPTDLTLTPDVLAGFLDDDQRKLYDLIFKRMLASQMESAVLDQVVVVVSSDDNYALARVTGSTIKFDGFYKIYREDKDDEEENDEGKIIPPLTIKENVILRSVEKEQHFTQPPPRYSEASLVKKLEELGIGRPSTYASIISVLQDREYVVLDKRRFVAKERGRLVSAFLTLFFEKYVEYDFTADLENRLDAITSGDIGWKQVLQDFWRDFSENIESVKEIDNATILRDLDHLLEKHIFIQKDDGSIDRDCPSCLGGILSLKLGKFGAFLGCSNYPNCRYTRPLGTDNNKQSAGVEGENNAVVNANEPKVLGIDKKTNLEVSLRKGPYGFYVQLGGDVEGEKPKRTSIPRNLSISDVDLEKALELLQLPRKIGTHPETGLEIIANIGRYGPYIQHDKKYISLKGDDDVLSVGINRAVTLIAENAKKTGLEPIKILGNHPEDNEKIAVYDGKYGHYIKYGKNNVPLPKNVVAEKLSLNDAVELIAKKLSKKAGNKKRKSKAKTSTVFNK